MTNDSKKIKKKMKIFQREHTKRDKYYFTDF